MAYSNFTSITKFCRQYNLNLISGKTLFYNVEKVKPSTRLTEDMEEAELMPISTEKAKSEWIIGPVLKELKRRNPHISVFSGFKLNIESDAVLQGNPDYILSAVPNTIEIVAPIFCLMESKNKTPDEGYAQCAAEMYAARLFNQENNDPYETIFGAVTNGFDWVFLKLEDDKIIIDKDRYFLNDLPLLLGILQTIVDIIKT